MSGLELLLFAWLLSRGKKGAGATGPRSEARSGRAHFAPDTPASLKPGATGPKAVARKGRGHF